MSLLHMFDHEFMRNAFIAITVLSPACGLVGYFVVLRNEVFAGDSLTHVAFTGSLGALAYGVNQRAGLFAATLVTAALLGLFSQRARIGDVAMGATFTWILGIGALFLSLFTASRNTSDSQASVNVLFGSVFGISNSGVVQAGIIGVAVTTIMVTLIRPLLFASIDAAVAAAQGIPTRGIAVGFMVIVGLLVAEVTQVTGALLLLGLLATPAATAQRITSRPYIAMWLSVGLCVADGWVGLTLSYEFASIPPSFAVIAVAFVGLVTATVAGAAGHQPREHESAPPGLSQVQPKLPV